LANVVGTDKGLARIIRGRTSDWRSLASSINGATIIGGARIIVRASIVGIGGRNVRASSSKWVTDRN